MKIADLNTGVGRLRDAFDALQQSWAEAQLQWNDANSRNIEEQHLQPLAGELATALAAIQHLGDVLAQAERDCEP